MHCWLLNVAGRAMGRPSGKLSFHGCDTYLSKPQMERMLLEISLYWLLKAISNCRLRDILRHVDQPCVAAQMAPAVRKRAPGRLIKEAPSFGLQDFSYRSFQINNGWNQVCLHSRANAASR